MILLSGSLARDERLCLWQTLNDEAKSIVPPAAAPKITVKEPIIVWLSIRVGLKARIRDSDMPVGGRADGDQTHLWRGKGPAETIKEEVQQLGRYNTNLIHCTLAFQ